jgi:nicotinate-nucleotide--dimethylbenzimidazole phosphoribosyltransferase
MREPEPTAAPAAPTVAWRAPTPTKSEIAASTNGNVVPPAPSDDARYDDIWTAAFATPQQADEHQAAEPQADEHQIAELQAAARQAAEPEASVPQPSEPQQMTEPTRPEPPPASAPESTPEVAAEDRPAPPEDEVSAEDDMWSLRARLAEAAARKHPPRTGT